jgi:hypothetical protein
MLMVVPRRQAIRTLKGWAIAVLLEAGAIRECEEHGWTIDRADPQASRSRLRYRPPRSAARHLAQGSRAVLREYQLRLRSAGTGSLAMGDGSDLRTRTAELGACCSGVAGP